MLILTRRLGEVVVIGDNIRIHILGVEGERVKLGIEAPREISIVRSELLEKVRESNLEAARVNFSRVRSIQQDLQNVLSARKEQNQGEECTTPSAAI